MTEKEYIRTGSGALITRDKEGLRKARKEQERDRRIVDLENRVAYLEQIILDRLNDN